MESLFSNHNTEVIMKRQLCNLMSVDSDSWHQKVETVSNTLVTPLISNSFCQQQHPSSAATPSPVSINQPAAEITSPSLPSITLDDQPQQSDAAVLPKIHEAAFHPPKCFKYQQTGDRKCQHQWFNKWHWLHYDSEQNCLLCFVCATAIANHLLDTSGKKVENVFTQRGFSNWKKEHDKFIQHEE